MDRGGGASVPPPILTLLLAAGSQQRWQRSGGRGLKQFIVVDGEPLVHRAFRLASGYSPVITLVEDPSQSCWQGLNPRAPASEEWMGEMGKFLDGRPYWIEGDIVVLYADAYYTKATLDTIYSTRLEQPTIYGRAQQGSSESFAIRFRNPQDVEEVERICHAVAAANMNHRGGPWRFFYHRHTGGTRYTRTERKLLTSLATRENGWVEVGHDATDDFDSHKQLASWLKRNPRHSLREPAA